jgi:hypothetical protein
MTIDQGVEDILNAGGAPSAKFPTVGTTIKGTIETAVVSQQQDFTTGEPKVWKDGNPAMQIVVTLATDERDAEIENDDGTRRLFVKGQMLSALKDALKTAGVKTLEVGGTLAVQYKSDGERSDPKFNPPKVYVAQYKAPEAAAAAVVVDELI